MPNFEIVNGMQGRFVFTMAGREVVVRGSLATCNSETNYEGPFTHVNLVKGSGRFVRVAVDKLVSFEPIYR